MRKSPGLDSALIQIVRQLLACGLCGIVCASCTIKAQIEDISQSEVSFLDPSADSFTNNTSFVFKVQISSANFSFDSATMEIYEGPDCVPANLVGQNVILEAHNVASSASDSDLQDGKVYSARFLIKRKDKVFQSKCSPSVGVDTQNPNPVTVSYPAGNGFVGTKEILAAWSSTTDNGISGLSDVPYILRLYGQAACGGAVLQKVQSSTEQHKFNKLTQGVTYSVEVTSVDKAGNESVLSCSPYVEVDVNIPGFSLSDPTSSDSYSRVSSPNLSINNDSQAAYWCFTKDLAFVPTVYTDACPGGTGPLNGWYTSRPTTLPLGAGEGLKAFNLWLFRGDGSLISHNVSSGAITLDQTLPGSFTVAGVGGLNDAIYDGWMTSSGQPRIKWNDSTDAVKYIAQIRTAGNALVCSSTELAAPLSEFTFDNCPVLSEGQTYRVHITSYDLALNSFQAPDFNFIVDRIPPGTFLISGITGGNDTTVDSFLGVGSPTVNYGSSAGSTRYRVQIKDASSGLVICTLGDKAGQSGFFDYASEVGVACTGLLDGGNYKAYVSAFDDGENETQAANNGFDFKVDTLVPVLTLDSVPTSPTSDTFADFAFTASDSLSGIASVSCQLDGAGYLPCASPKNYNGLAEGTHTVQVRAKDVAGNMTTLFQSWNIDLTNPLLVIDARPSAVSNNVNISFVFHATDASGVVNYACSLNAAPFASCASPYSFSVGEGSYTFAVKATDSVGFYDQKSENFLVDLTPPTVNLNSVPAAYSASSTASFSFTGSDTGGSGVGHFECSMDGGAFSVCTSTKSITGLADGSHLFSLKAFDLAGNPSSSVSSAWLIYTAGPTVSLSSTPTNPTNSTSAIFNFAATTPAGISVTGYLCQIDGGAYSACSSPKTYSGLAGGSHSVNIKATDSLGNTGTPVPYTWTVYTYNWIAGGYGACDAAQPAYTYGAFGACDAAQPAFTYGSYGACSATCGGGVQTRSESCPINWGNQYRSQSCPLVSGNQWRSVQCQRSDTAIVADANCNPGSKPAANLACSRGGGSDCNNAQATSQACTRGGGGDCHSSQGTTQSCNTQSCIVYHILPNPGGTLFGMCPEGAGAAAGVACTIPGFSCNSPNYDMYTALSCY